MNADERRQLARTMEYIENQLVKLDKSVSEQRATQVLHASLLNSIGETLTEIQDTQDRQAEQISELREKLGQTEQ